MSGPVLSVVVPMYNEQAVLPLFVERLRPVLDGLETPYEVVAVDDGSHDNTFTILSGVLSRWPELRVIRLRRNAGHQAALSAGLGRSLGEYVLTIDADLQDPPELIPAMLAMAREESLDVIYGIRQDRSSDTVFKRWTSDCYYRLMRRVVGASVPSHAGDFRLMSRPVVEALQRIPEQTPVYRLVVPWLGFPSGEVGYVRDSRPAGETKYPLARMVRLATDSVTAFSAAPLRLATWLGGIGFVTCAILTLVAVVTYFVGFTVPGWTSLYVAVLFLGATQLLCLGLLGEYVARIYIAVQDRPSYFVAYDSATSEAPDMVEAVR